MARRRRSPWALLAAVYALAYTRRTYLHPGDAGGGAASAQPWADRVRAPAGRAVGLVAGQLLHPNFPHNLLILEDPEHRLLPVRLAAGDPRLGPEIKPRPLSDYLRVHFLCRARLFIGAAALRRRQRVSYETAVFAIGGAAFG